MEKKQKSLGHVMNVKVKLTSPIETNIDNLDLNSLTMMAGSNGSGKTMINKIVYFSSLCTLIDLAEKHQEGLGELDFGLQTFTERVQFIFNNVFTDPVELSGDITAHFENGTFSCNIFLGKVSKIVTDYDEDVTSGTYPKYMSTNTRLFTAVESILLMDKTLPGTKILDHCKLYDLFHCHVLRNFALNVKNLPEDLITTFKEGYDFDIVSLTYDEEKCLFYYNDSTGKTRKVSSLGAGHQSIINMFIGTRA